MSKEKLTNQLKNAYKQLEEEFKNKGRPNTIEDNNVDYDNCNIYAMRQKIFDLEAKLAEFEDFMEEQGFESLDVFRTTISLNQLMNKVGIEHFKENQALKARWEKLKEYLTQKTEDDYVGCYIYPDNLKAMEDILEKMQELEK